MMLRTEFHIGLAMPDFGGVHGETEYSRSIKNDSACIDSHVHLASF